MTAPLKGKKQQKRIRCFWEIRGTLDKLGAEAEETKEFFTALKNLEDSYDAKTNIVFVTDFSMNEATPHLDRIKEQFAQNDMDKRITSCICNDGFMDFREQDLSHEYNYGINKSRIVQRYDFYFEHNHQNVALCLYAGANAHDRAMAESHIEGKAYKRIPCAFIDTKDVRNSFAYGKDNQTRNLGGSAEQSDCRAITHGALLLTDPVIMKAIQETPQRLRDDSSQ